LGFEFTREVRDAYDGMADLISIEDVGRQAVAASMAGAQVVVDRDAAHDTGKISGSDSTDRSAAV
jgi:hypothetical protein